MSFRFIIQSSINIMIKLELGLFIRNPILIDSRPNWPQYMVYGYLDLLSMGFVKIGMITLHWFMICCRNRDQII